MLTQAVERHIAAHPDFDQHEQVLVCKNDDLHAIIAVHNSRLGPATGGCRIYPYDSLDGALSDVLRLSRSMTFKSAMAGLPLGGGKSVILANPATDKSRQMLHAMGDFIESLQGRYVAAEDSGTTVQDIALMGERTSYVSGYRSNEEFGGDPSPVTARGVFNGIAEAVRFRYGTGLRDVRVAIQGVGNVGFHLARMLADAGARVTVADANADKARAVSARLGVACCHAGDILALEVDVLAPCAMGATINTQTVDAIQAQIIAGAANNQLESEQLGTRLLQRDILYAPDYVINAGGIIDIHYQQQGVRDQAHITAHLQIITQNLAQIFEQSRQQQRATNVIADELARARFLQAPVCVAVA
ncbi:MAG: Glu/Leu/Phe/Val dehydrogenase dimerization domain-containing protein [Pseudohongiellaceae bacterium]